LGGRFIIDGIAMMVIIKEFWLAQHTLGSMHFGFMGDWGMLFISFGGGHLFGFISFKWG